MLKAREYRYLSPTFYHTRDGVVTRMEGAALTNNPADVGSVDLVVQTVEPEGRLGLGLDVQLALKRPDRWWGCKAHANLPDPPLPYKRPEPGLLPSAGVTRLPR